MNKIDTIQVIASKHIKDTHLPVGNSDPVSYTCTCSAAKSPDDGLVLLFYRYYSASPTFTPLPSETPSALVAFHTHLATTLSLTGKLRLSAEGFNITVAGSHASITTYITSCINHWSFSGLSLSLSDPSSIRAFFKPTPGCACVFPSLSIREAAEITPMGVTNYVPTWNAVTGLSPAEFHERCLERKGKVLVDVRNHYESRIGHFVDPVTGEKAVMPAIRRFAQWPQYVKTHLEELGARIDAEDVTAESMEGRSILTYCTGGIRCEKGARFLAESMSTSLRDGDRVFTLDGGIAAYMMWMDEEIAQGHKTAEESLFKGKNYVFDARGSTGLEEGKELTVSECHICGVAEDRLSKCRSKGCHLVLVVCDTCEKTHDGPRCCPNCLEMDSGEMIEGRRPMCQCEREREEKLWGADATRPPRTQGWRTATKRNATGINIPFKLSPKS